MTKIGTAITCHEYHHIKENYTFEDYEYANKKAKENPDQVDVSIPIQISPLVYLEQFDVWMYESLILRTNKHISF